MKVGEKKLANFCDSPNSLKFFPSKVFYYTVYNYTLKIKVNQLLTTSDYTSTILKEYMMLTCLTVHGVD